MAHGEILDDEPGDIPKELPFSNYSPGEYKLVRINTVAKTWGPFTLPGDLVYDVNWEDLQERQRKLTYLEREMADNGFLVWHQHICPRRLSTGTQQKRDRQQSKKKAQAAGRPNKRKK